MGHKRMFFFGFSGMFLALVIFTSIYHEIYGISIKIESPLSNQQVPVGELTIRGTSSDNSTSQCQVYVDLNNLKPYQLATATGPNGTSDFSTWSYTYTAKYHLIQTGLNDLTSKITCLVPPGGPTVTKWYSVNVTGSTSASQASTQSSNQSSNVQLPLPTADKTLTSSVQTTSPSAETPIDTTETSNSDRIKLDLMVEQNPISAGERQTVTLKASDPATGTALDKVFLRLTIKDPSGNIIKDYTDNDGSLSPSFRLGEDITGSFSVLASASQAGIETTKSTSFVVK